MFPPPRRLPQHANLCHHAPILMAQQVAAIHEAPALLLRELQAESDRGDGDRVQPFMLQRLRHTRHIVLVRDEETQLVHDAHARAIQLELGNMRGANSEQCSAAAALLVASRDKRRAHLYVAEE